SQQSFDAVLALIRAQQHCIDLVVCTGDLTQDASEAAYRRFHGGVDSLGAPQRWLPGNHDEPAAFARALGSHSECLEKRYALGAWDVLLLDSAEAGQVHGRLRAEELAFLREGLERCQALQRHALVCLHHNPLPVAAAWLQRHALQNSDALFALLDDFSCVRGVVWGHVHQEQDGERRGVRLLGTPSTCVQFHPERDEFTLDRRNPGYRWLDLLPDGGIRSGVERVSGESFSIDFSSSGY